MNQISTYKLDGFEVLKLENAWVSVQVVPQCGAKIISLKDRRADREWLWRPGNELKLFSNPRGDSFARSPLTGIDECLPTIIACGESIDSRISIGKPIRSKRALSLVFSSSFQYSSGRSTSPSKHPRSMEDDIEFRFLPPAGWGVDRLESISRSRKSC